MRADVHISDDSGFVNDECCGTCDIVSLKAEPVVDTITLNDTPGFVYQQWECDAVFVSVASEFTGPLSCDGERSRCVFCVCFNVFLYCRQLAATVRSPRPSKKG